MSTTRRGFLGSLLAIPAALRAIPGIAQAPPGEERDPDCVHCLDGMVHVGDPGARKILQRDEPAGARIGVALVPEEGIISRAEGSYIPEPRMQTVEVVMVPCPTCRPASHRLVMEPVAAELFGGAPWVSVAPPLVISRAGTPHPFHP